MPATQPLCPSPCASWFPLGSNGELSVRGFPEHLKLYDVGAAMTWARGEIDKWLAYAPPWSRMEYAKATLGEGNSCDNQDFAAVALALRASSADSRDLMDLVVRIYALEVGPEAAFPGRRLNQEGLVGYIARALNGNPDVVRAGIPRDYLDEVVLRADGRGIEAFTSGPNTENAKQNFTSGLHVLVEAGGTISDLAQSNQYTDFESPSDMYALPGSTKIIPTGGFDTATHNPGKFGVIRTALWLTGHTGIPSSSEKTQRALERIESDDKDVHAGRLVSLAARIGSSADVHALLGNDCKAVSSGGFNDTIHGSGHATQATVLLRIADRLSLLRPEDAQRAFDSILSATLNLDPEYREGPLARLAKRIGLCETCDEQLAKIEKILKSARELPGNGSEEVHSALSAALPTLPEDRRLATFNALLTDIRTSFKDGQDLLAATSLNGLSGSLGALTGKNRSEALNDFVDVASPLPGAARAVVFKKAFSSLARKMTDTADFRFNEILQAIRDLPEDDWDGPLVSLGLEISGLPVKEIAPATSGVFKAVKVIQESGHASAELFAALAELLKIQQQDKKYDVFHQLMEVTFRILDKRYEAVVSFLLARLYAVILELPSNVQRTAWASVSAGLDGCPPVIRRALAEELPDRWSVE